MGFATILAVGSQVAYGFMQYSQQKNADKAEKRAYEDAQRITAEQNALDAADADRAAKEELDQSDRIRKIQKMAYLKSGVVLDGSPLLVMEETRAKGEENAKNIRDNQRSRANLNTMSTAANKPVSRASLTRTIAETGAGLANTYNDYSLLQKQIA